MKKIIIASAFALSALGLSAQERLRAFYCDPEIRDMRITDMATGAAVNADRLYVGSPVKVQFTLRNNDVLNPVPAGTAMVKLTLGSTFKVFNDILPAQDELPLKDYFRWSITDASRTSQFIIVGELIRDLPARFSAPVEFRLMPFMPGGSVATAQLLVTNHDGRGGAILSDMQPNNNAAMAAYTNLKPLGIRFTALRAQPHGCVLEVNWSVFDEDKAASKYIIEVSEDGNNYRPVRTVLSTGINSYNVFLEGLTSTQVNVRVRVEAASANDYLYSDKVTATNLCDKKFEIALYPNPVPSDASEITLTAKAGIFNGKYQIRLSDASGREVKRADVTYSNQLNVRFPLGVITGGSYYITVVDENGQAQALTFVKQ